MSRLNPEQLAGFRRQTPPPTAPEHTTGETVRVAPPQTPAPVRQRRDTALSARRTSTERQGGSKAVLHLPLPVASQLRETSRETGYPMSRIVTAAVLEAEKALRAELDGGVPVLRARGAPGREAFTFWLSESTRRILKELADLGGISASEVAARALGPFLDRLHSSV